MKEKKCKQKGIPLQNPLHIYFLWWYIDLYFLVTYHFNAVESDGDIPHLNRHYLDVSTVYTAHVSPRNVTAPRLQNSSLQSARPEIGCVRWNPILSALPAIISNLRRCIKTIIEWHTFVLLIKTKTVAVTYLKNEFEFSTFCLYRVWTGVYLEYRKIVITDSKMRPWCRSCKENIRNVQELNFGVVAGVGVVLRFGRVLQW